MDKRIAEIAVKINIVAIIKFSGNLKKFEFIIRILFLYKTIFVILKVYLKIKIY
jgi:hypothetical protein